MFLMHLNLIPAAANCTQVKDATADGGKYLLKMDTEGRMTHIFWMTATQVRACEMEGRTDLSAVQIMLEERSNAGATAVPQSAQKAELHLIKYAESSGVR